MKNTKILLWFCVLFFLSCDKSIKAENPNNYVEPTTPLILISVDGFRWDYFDKVETPNFDRIINNGIKAEGLKTVYPSKTFPNHLSIITGNYPSNHGIISNYFYDPSFDEYYYIGAGSVAAQDGKWIQAEPIWVTVEKQLRRAMIMFWPMSDAEIQGIRPSEYYVYSDSPTNISRMEQLLNWLDLDGRNKPTFLASYFSVVDTIGHRYGPNSPEVIDSIIEVDQAIGHLLNGLEERGILNDVNLLIVSDHGMVETPTDQIINIADYIDLDSVVTIGGGPFMEIRPNDNDIENIYQQLQNIDHTQVFKKEDFPEKFNYSNNDRIEPIIFLADEGWSIQKPGRSPSPGTHGYDPDYKSMDGIFIARGPGFKENFDGPQIQSVHLYEMMCHLMEIVPAQNDGSLAESEVFLR
tara:strand:- start:1036 stop:2262 length:1227 start_codon:yes stop_codon:yes gene_type:complete